MVLQMTEQPLSNPEVQKMIKSGEKFDVVIVGNPSMPSVDREMILNYPKRMTSYSGLTIHYFPSSVIL
nr:unnamed protein product [Callosobruchus chinensis]